MAANIKSMTRRDDISYASGERRAGDRYQALRDRGIKAVEAEEELGKAQEALEYAYADLLKEPQK